MNQWRRCIIRLLLAVFLLLCVLLLTWAEEDVEAWPEHDLHHRHQDEAQGHFGGRFAEPPRVVARQQDRSCSTEEDNAYVDELLSVDVEDEGNLDLEGVVSPSAAPEHEEVYLGPEFAELPHCSQGASEDEELKPAVVVSTLDGRITAMDLASGQVLWSQQTGGTYKAMLHSSMSKLEVTSRGEWVRLIPSLDGGIFRFDGDAVEALPVTADNLLHSSFKFNPDTIFTGGKATEVLGMSLGTGRLVYFCDSSGCRRQKTATRPLQVLVVRRITQTVRAVDPKSGDERWNFSVGQHEVNMAGGGCTDFRGSREEHLPLPSLHFVVPDGVVMAVDHQGALVWKQKLTSPVVHAWRVLDGELEDVDLFSTSSVPALNPDHQQEGGEAGEQQQQQQPALYIGVHHKQLYIQQSGGMRSRVDSAVKVFTADMAQEGAEVKFPRVKWRPYLATAPSRTPIYHYGSQPHPLLIGYEAREEAPTAVAVTHHIDYPYDNGYYLYADSTVGLNLSRPLEKPYELEEEERVEETIMEEVAAHILHICFHIGPEVWLQVGLGVVMYSLLHFLALRYMLAHMRQQLTQQALLMVRHILLHVLQNNPHIVALIQRLGIHVPALPAPPPPAPAPPKPVTPPTSPAAQQLGPPDKAEAGFSEYTSRYLSDFELVRCLGRGGFGVVFQVQNKLDENDYAVKRIVLPSKKSSAERVKREVRALAKLNHTNIVRYYNSWLETPPPGWQDEVDALWKKEEQLSASVFSPCSKEQHKEETRCRKAEAPGHHSLAWVVDEHSGCWPGGADALNHPPATHASATDALAHPPATHASVTALDRRKDDSFDIVFEDSCNASESLEDKDLSGNVVQSGDCDNSGDSYSSSALHHHSGEGQANFSVHSDSQSIVFQDSVNNLNLSVHSGKTEGEVSSTSNRSASDGGGERWSSGRRRRVRSQPAGGGPEQQEARPSTLSLPSHHQDSRDGRTLLYIQMELCQKETLKDWLVQNQLRDKSAVLNLFNDIVRAVEYVHDNHLMHRDLKPSNIFFSLDGEVKIGDFGLVTTIAEEEQVCTPGEAGPVLITPDKSHTHQVGTQLYMSPEQVNGQVYDYKVDIYTLGLILFEMLVPFSTVMERITVMTKLRHGHFPHDFEANFPDEYEILQLMLSREPARRPTTRGLRARQPLRPLQGRTVEDILPEDHFRLTTSRQRSLCSSASSVSFSSSSSS